MDLTRLALRLCFRIERLLNRLNALLSAIYMSLIVGLISVTCYVYFKILRPLVNQTMPWWQATLHTACCLYFMFSVVTNYIGCLVTCPGRPPYSADPESEAEMKKVCDKGSDSAVTKSEVWRYCTICGGAKPPRVHHCSVCKACYYKLCHHCPALGKCVGRENYPFFWRFVMASWWGALFASASCAYLRSKQKDVDTEEVLFFMTIGGCAVGTAVGVLGAWHMLLLMTGQTTIECLENLQMRRRGMGSEEWGKWGGPFNKGVRQNIREAFGEIPWRYVPWWTILLFPIKRIITENVIC